MSQPTSWESWAAASCAAALAVLWAPAAGAQPAEVICDPENPACQPAQPEPAAPGGRGEETICDPENPACSSEAPAPEPAAPQGAAPPGPTLTEPDFGTSGVGQEVSFGGSWGSSLAVDTSRDGAEEDALELGTGLDAALEYDPSVQLGVVVRGQLRHWMAGRAPEDEFFWGGNAQGRRGDLEVRLGESYVTWRPGRFVVRAGHLITSWGSTDLTRPGQVINPRDQRNFGWVGPSASDGVLPQPAVEAGWSGAGWSITGLLVPFFTPDEVVLFGRDLALASSRSPLGSSFPVASFFEQAIDPSAWEQAQGLAWSPSYPDELLRSASLGGRATATAWNTDVGLGYFWGWDRTPWVEIDEDAAQLAQILLGDEEFFQDLDFLGLVGRNPEILELSERLSEKQQMGQELFVQEYLRRHTVVADLARYVGPIGVRADVAWSPAQNFTTEELGTIRRPSIFGALGLSYERVEGERQLGVTVEGFWLHPFGAEAAMTRWFVDPARRGEPGEDPIIVGEGLYGVAGGLSWDVPWIGTRLQAGGVYNISSRDLIARALVRRELGWGVHGTLGWIVYEGPPPSERLTLGGLYDPNDQVILGLDGAF